MRGASGSLLIIVGIVALWIALTGKLDAFAHFWTELTTGTVSGGVADATAGTTPGGGSLYNQIQQDIKNLPNPPQIPPSVVNSPFWNPVSR